MDKRFKYILAILALVILALNILPVMSTYVSGSLEHSTIIVRGYNLIEFSALGCIPLFASLLLPTILFSNHSNELQNIEFTLLIIVSTISYVHTLNAARLWLHSISDSVVIYHPEMMAFPLGFIAVLILSRYFSIFSKWHMLDT